jgi:hypothetical protein
LTRYGITPRISTLETRYLDLRPGMTVEIDLPPWDMSGTWLIETVQMRHLLQQQNDQHVWASQLTVIEGDISRGSWLDFWRGLGGTGGGTGTGFTGSGTPGPGSGAYLSTGGGPLDFGGDRFVTRITQNTWYPIPNFVDVLLPPGTVWTMRGHTWVLDSAHTIQIRIVALTAIPEVTEIQLGESTNATDQYDPLAFQEFNFTTYTSWQYYRLEMKVSNGGEGWAAGLEAYPVITPAPTA